MPEGHTLHRLARDLGDAFVGSAPRVSSPQGRFAAGAALLDGHRLDRTWAHGKLLFAEFEAERVLHVHLGLIGKFPVVSLGGRPAPAVRGAVRLRLLDADHVADLSGPMVCSVLTPPEADALVARQGPDPLQAGADPEVGWERIRASRRSVAELLMDQRVIAGVGNVYRCEVLFRHRIAPLRPGRGLKRASWEAIWADLVALMPVGVATGRIVTEEDDLAEVQAALAAGHAPSPDRRYAVYKRTGEPCLRCGSRIRQQPVAGRILYWCGSCQRRS